MEKKLRLIEDFFLHIGQIVVQSRIPESSCQVLFDAEDDDNEQYEKELFERKLGTRDQFNTKITPWAGLAYEIDSKLKTSSWTEFAVMSIEIFVKSHDLPEDVLVERWSMKFTASEYGNQNLKSDPYLSMIILARSIYSHLRILPTHSIFKNRRSRGGLDSSAPFDLYYRISTGGGRREQNFLYDVNNFNFSSVETHTGCLNVSVTYRPKLKFDFVVPIPGSDYDHCIINDYYERDGGGRSSNIDFSSQSSPKPRITHHVRGGSAPQRIFEGPKALPPRRSSLPKFTTKGQGRWPPHTNISNNRQEMPNNLGSSPRRSSPSDRTMNRKTIHHQQIINQHQQSFAQASTVGIIRIPPRRRNSAPLPFNAKGVPKNSITAVSPIPEHRTKNSRRHPPKNRKVGFSPPSQSSTNRGEQIPFSRSPTNYQQKNLIPSPQHRRGSGSKASLFDLVPRGQSGNTPTLLRRRTTDDELKIADYSQHQVLNTKSGSPSRLPATFSADPNEITHHRRHSAQNIHQHQYVTTTHSRDRSLSRSSQVSQDDHKTRHTPQHQHQHQHQHQMTSRTTSGAISNPVAIPRRGSQTLIISESSVHSTHSLHTPPFASSSSPQITPKLLSNNAVQCSPQIQYLSHRPRTSSSPSSLPDLEHRRPSIPTATIGATATTSGTATATVLQSQPQQSSVTSLSSISSPGGFGNVTPNSGRRFSQTLNTPPQLSLGPTYDFMCEGQHQQQQGQGGGGDTIGGFGCNDSLTLDSEFKEHEFEPQAAFASFHMNDNDSKMGSFVKECKDAPKLNMFLNPKNLDSKKISVEFLCGQLDDLEREQKSLREMCLF